MQKSTFKIATKFSLATHKEDGKPIEFTEVEGFTIGNWGITNWGIDGNQNAGGGDYWVIYHTLKGLRLDFLYFDWDNAVKILELTVKLFGKNHDGENTAASREALQTWERESRKLAARSCLYFDDDDDDCDDTDGDD